MDEITFTWQAAHIHESDPRSQEMFAVFEAYKRKLHSQEYSWAVQPDYVEQCPNCLEAPNMRPLWVRNWEDGQWLDHRIAQQVRRLWPDVDNLYLISWCSQCHAPLWGLIEQKMNPGW